MIEFCNKKRMAVAIVILISISVCMLIIESVWPTEKRVKEVQLSADLGKDNGTCKSKKETVVENCKRCSKTELRALVHYCQDTGYKEVVLCDDGKRYSKSCDISPYMDEKRFWIFEAVTLFIGLISYGVVRIRQKKLDKMLMEKINRQIAFGL